MEKSKTTLRSIKRFLRAFDFFGESFTFKYKDEDKHSTILGGLICIIFFAIAISYFIYNFIPFARNENFTLQYYTVNSNADRPINLKDDPIAFGVGLTNDNQNATYNIMDLFNISIKFTYYQNKSDIKTIIPHKCNKADFHNRFDNSIFENLFCIESEYTPEGIFTENKFSYYTISVASKYKNNESHNEIINNYLIENDCKFQFYYTDIEINLKNKEEPFSPFLNSMFLQLNPTVIQKKNIYYANYHLTDDDSIIRLGSEDPHPVIKTGLSRTEDYSLYKGLDRTSRDDNDNINYAKIYIRADNRKIDIKRRYQDFMEFYADTSALLLSIFWILGVILAYYDRKVTNHSISKKLFYFEGIKNNRFEQFKNIKKFMNNIEELEKKNINENSGVNGKNNDKEKHSKHNSMELDPRSSRIIIEEIKSQIESKKEKEEEGKKEEEKNEEKKGRNKEKDLIDYSSYTILEMIGSLKIFFCCRTEKFNNKINLIEQANNTINDKLDIVFYIRNMLLLRLIKKIYLENNNIIDFLTRPIINLNNYKKGNKTDTILNDAQTNNSMNSEIFCKKEEKKLADTTQYFEGDLYKSAYKLNQDILYENIGSLILYPDKTNAQKELISLLKVRFDQVDLEKNN